MKNKEQHIFPFLERLLDGAEVEWKPLGEVAELKRGTSITKKTSKEGKYPVISGGQQPAYYIDTFNRDGETITVAGSGAYAGFVMFWNEPIFVSDAFSIKTEESLVLPRYVYHFLLNIQGKIYSLKTGSGVPHVYAKDVGLFLIPIPCPSKPEKSLEIQRKIVDILDKFMTLEAELDCRKRQYEYYRNQLLSFDMLNRGGQRLNNVINNQRFLDNEIVEWLPIGSITKYEQPTNYLVKSTNYHESYATPVLTAGKTFILGYTNEENGIYKASKAPVIIFDDFTTANKWVDFDFKAKSSAMKMITSQDESKVLLRYIYYWLNTLPTEIVEGDHKRQWISSFCNKKIPIPCPSKPEKSLEVQRKIVSILDKFDTLVNSISEGLPKEIELRRKQYEYYCNQLLSFPEHKVSA